jgi:hypothetical protein
MASVDDATASQIANLEAKTGRSLDEWIRIALATPDGSVPSHKAIVDRLKAEHGLGHGYANLVALRALRPPDAPDGDSLVETWYAGPKARLRPLHDAVVAVAEGLGPDVELAPKKTYLSLRRRKQFAMVGPGPGGTLEIGLNLPNRPVAGRLQASTGMASRRVRITTAEELDAEFLGWLREAYEEA